VRDGHGKSMGAGIGWTQREVKILAHIWGQNTRWHAGRGDGKRIFLRTGTFSAMAHGKDVDLAAVKGLKSPWQWGVACVVSIGDASVVLGGVPCVPGVRIITEQTTVSAFFTCQPRKRTLAAPSRAPPYLQGCLSQHRPPVRRLLGCTFVSPAGHWIEWSHAEYKYLTPPGGSPSPAMWAHSSTLPISFCWGAQNGSARPLHAYRSDTDPVAALKIVQTNQDVGEGATATPGQVDKPCPRDSDMGQAGIDRATGNGPCEWALTTGASVLAAQSGKPGGGRLKGWRLEV